MSQVLRECAIDTLTTGMSTRAVARSFNVHFSTIRRVHRRFREFSSTPNLPNNRRTRVWRCMGEQFADVNVVNRVPHGGSGVMIWAGTSYGQWTLLCWWVRTQKRLNRNWVYLSPNRNNIILILYRKCPNGDNRNPLVVEGNCRISGNRLQVPSGRRGP
jgi:hypothetical protein